MMNPKLLLVLATAAVACQSPPPDRETLHSQLPDRPYSAVVRVGDTYYFSGKIGATDETRAMTDGRTAAEVRNIMEAFDTLFQELGLEFADVVQGSVFLIDMDDYAAMNAAYGEYFTSDPPARSTIAVAALPGDANVEIAFTAVKALR
ncbi:MAG TPA: Rid family hydrolase [Gemmatimonadota bacterium]|nr:Rid family hydrolase [Gemmatimonadota bacterium]